MSGEPNKPVTPEVVVVRRTATPERRARLVHLLAVLLDKPAAPGKDDLP